MRFAAVSTMIDPKKRYTQSQLLDTLREQVVMAEDMGFEAFWLGEHHFWATRHGQHPQPDTGRGRPRSTNETHPNWPLANIAVWWHPLRLARTLPYWTT